MHWQGCRYTHGIDCRHAPDHRAWIELRGHVSTWGIEMSKTRMTPAWLLVLAAMVMQAGCTRAPPEQELRDALSSLQASIEARDVSALETTLASDFVGHDGLDRDGAARLARLMYLRHRDIGATVGPPRISVQDQHATVGFTAALTGGGGGMLPDAASVHDVETAWRLEDGEWRMISAHWTPRL